MRADQFISEVSMRPTRLARAVENISATVGMEFELILPKFGGSDDFEPEPNYEYDRQIRSIDDVISFFDVSDYNSQSTLRRAEKKLREQYYEYLTTEAEKEWDSVEEEQLAEYYHLHHRDMPEEEQKEEIESDLHLKEYSVRYRHLKQRFIEDFIEDGLQHEYREREFLSDEYGRNMSDINGNYDLVWPYYTYQSETDDDSEFEEAAKSLQGYVKQYVLHSTRHGGVRQANAFTVEPDSSVIPNDEDTEFGVEVVSPPMNVSEMFSALDNIRRWADYYDAYTNDTCGLHMSVSVPGYNYQDSDYVKLVLLLGDKYILEKFSREMNDYCSSVFKRIAELINKDPSQSYVERAFAVLKNTLNKKGNEILIDMGLTIPLGGHISINPSSSSVGPYIEFRGPGGDWLGMLNTTAGQQTIQNTLLRCVVALDAATKPELYRNDYLKKLYALLRPYYEPFRTVNDSRVDVVELFAAYSAGALDTNTLKRKLNTFKYSGSIPAYRSKYNDMEYAIYSKSDPTKVFATFASVPTHAHIDFVKALRDMGQNKPTDFTYAKAEST